MKFRPRFSLRMLFVLVTIIGVGAGWVAYQLNWIRQRHNFLNCPPVYLTGVVELGNDPSFQSPWTLRLFGEKPIFYLMGVDADHVDQAKRLFPEATVNPDVDTSTW